MDVLLILAIYLLIVNLAGFAAMGIDKNRARRKAWRIPESTLFLLAIIGGSIGSIAGMYTFHHKTLHPQFVWGMPAIFVMAKNLFPETIDKISNELTPMVATARLIKQEHPDASVVFIGPCASKKLEASRRTVRSDVDFVITFEELTGMFEAKGILLDEIKAMDEMKDATAAGRGYGVAGGVANAIKECIEKYYPGTPVNIQHAESLAECKKALLLAARLDEVLEAAAATR